VNLKTKGLSIVNYWMIEAAKNNIYLFVGQNKLNS
jgi:hypothetical protein